MLVRMVTSSEEFEVEVPREKTVDVAEAIILVTVNREITCVAVC